MDLHRALPSPLSSKCLRSSNINNHHHINSIRMVRLTLLLRDILNNSKTVLICYCIEIVDSFHLRTLSKGIKRNQKLRLFHSPVVSLQLSIKIERENRSGFNGWGWMHFHEIVERNMQSLVTSLSRVRMRHGADDDHDNHQHYLQHP
mmetsp:Transcript_26241/g.62368  ORF Transcript_26241/g.62368 Transcript_26241/m.62368 type:complete len:147 (+) Transcript_26241:1428-1868(+)